ncbi:MAG: TonB-dependent receptor [Deltaproteobacteria bacterium]|nr:TonB-dependent receptor [Deltaproteobacteria bacterium]
MKKKCFTVLMCMLMVLPGLTQAKDEMPVSTLDEMVVTASRVPEQKKDLTTNITIIDENDIKMSTARDLGDLLAENGGIYIRKYPGDLTSIGLRGFRTETHGNDLMGHVLILLDGRRVATGNAAEIMTKNIKKIEIIRGPASVQYGSAAMGGIVNVITKRGEEKPSAFVEGMLGSFGYEEASAGVSGAVKGFDFSAAATRTTMDNYDVSDSGDKDGDKYHNTGFDEKTNLSLNFGYEFLPGNRIGVIYTDFDSDHAASPGYFTLNDLDDYNDKSNKSYDIIYEGQTASGLFSWMGRYFNSQDDCKWSEPTGSNPDFWDDGIPSERNTDQEGAQGQVTLNLDYLTFTAGVDWVGYDITTTWTPQKTEYENTAGFVLAKARLFDKKLILSGGLRYDEYDLEMKKPSGRDEDDNNVCPSIGIAYLINDYFKIRANYAEGFKMPDASAMSSDYWSWGSHYVGNPDLDPEESQTYEGGIDFSYPGTNASLTYFYTEFDDKIESATTPTGDRTWENIGSAAMSGFEGEFSADIGALCDLSFKIEPYLNLTYMNEFKDEQTHRDLMYVSDWTASYGISFADLNGLAAKLNFAYTGNQKITDYQFGTYDRIRLGGFTIVDFVVTKKLYDFNEFGSMTLRGEVKNLFDKDYAYVQGYPMPGRSFYIGLRYDY